MSELNKLLIDAGRNKVTNYNKTQTNKVIREAFFEVLGTENPTYKDIRENKKFFRIIEETIDYLLNEGIENNPFFQQFVDYRNLNLGDKNEFYAEDRSVLVASEVADGIARLRRSRLNVGDSFSVKTTTKHIGIYEDLHRVLAGRMDWDKFVVKVEDGFMRLLAEEVYTQFINAGQYLPSQFKETGAFDASKMHTVAEHVAATTGKAPVLAGTKAALRKITGSYSGGNSFLMSENMSNQVNQTGLLNTWEGYTLLEVPQIHKRNSFDFAVDSNKILVLGADQSPIKVVNEGEALVAEKTGMDNADMSQEYHLFKKYGVNTIFSELHGSYTLEG